MLPALHKLQVPHPPIEGGVELGDEDGKRKMHTFPPDLLHMVLPEEDHSVLMVIGAFRYTMEPHKSEILGGRTLDLRTMWGTKAKDSPPVWNLGSGPWPFPCDITFDWMALNMVSAWEEAALKLGYQIEVLHHQIHSRLPTSVRVDDDRWDRNKLTNEFVAAISNSIREKLGTNAVVTVEKTPEIPRGGYVEAHGSKPAYITLNGFSEKHEIVIRPAPWSYMCQVSHEAKRLGLEMQELERMKGAGSNRSAGSER